MAAADNLLDVADVAGQTHCLDPETGEAHWVYNAKSRVIASTMVADGKIYQPSERHLNILATGKTRRP